MATVSTTIPSISSLVPGPSIFSSAKGTPRLANNSMMVAKSLPHCGELAGPKIMKSSKYFAIMLDTLPPGNQLDGVCDCIKQFWCRPEAKR